MSIKNVIVGQSGTTPVAATGKTLAVHEWSGSGPVYMHVHHSDDEAWHVLSGVLRFKFADGELDAGPGATVFVPAGTPHTYWEVEPSRYLIFLTPRLDRLIAELSSGVGMDGVGAVLERYDSALS